MSERNKENLRKLFEKFVDPENAGQFAADIRQADEMLEQYSVPAPDDVLVAKIKSKIAVALLRRKAKNFRTVFYKAVAAAAVIIFAVLIGLEFHQKNDTMPGQIGYGSLVPEQIWVSEDAAFATLAAEVEQIEGEFLALRLGENGSESEGPVTELEIEYEEINSNFWKG